MKQEEFTKIIEQLYNELLQKIEEQEFFSIKTKKVRKSSIYLALRLNKEVKLIEKNGYYFGTRDFTNKLYNYVKFFVEGRDIDFKFSQTGYHREREGVLKCTEVLNITFTDLNPIHKKRGRPRKDPHKYNQSIENWVGDTK